MGGAQKTTGICQKDKGASGRVPLTDLRQCKHQQEIIVMDHNLYYLKARCHLININKGRKIIFFFQQKYKTNLTSADSASPVQHPRALPYFLFGTRGHPLPCTANSILRPWTSDSFTALRGLHSSEAQTLSQNCHTYLTTHSKPKQKVTLIFSPLDLRLTIPLKVPSV